MSSSAEGSGAAGLDGIETIVDGPVPIAVRDHRPDAADGPPLLLLHGAGANLLAWSRVVPLLPGRVLTVDLRGHGRSGDGPWTWDDVLDDIEAVVAHLRLDRPVVAGHSLGGMVAAMWARRHPECPTAISLDGHRAAATAPENYAGLPPERLHADLERLHAAFDAQAAAMARPLTAEEVEGLTAGLAAPPGSATHLQAQVVARNLDERPGGTWRRPDAATAEALRRSPEFTDCLPAFRQVTAPLLVAVATRDFAGLPPQFRGLMSAFRAGLRRDLADLTAACPNIVVREVDAGHDLVVERPQLAARIVVDALATLRRNLPAW